MLPRKSVNKNGSAAFTPEASVEWHHGTSATLRGPPCECRWTCRLANCICCCWEERVLIRFSQAGPGTQ